jgi:hypothetical protein
MAKQTTGEGAGEQQPGAGQENAGGDKKPKEKEVKLEACAELRRFAPDAEEMFGRFMLAVATRNMTAGDIAETAERLTAIWKERKGKFAAK